MTDPLAALFPPGASHAAPPRPDAAARPLWVAPDGAVLLEAFAPAAAPAREFLAAVAEPVSRPSRIHEFRLTPHSLYAAVSVGLSTAVILDALDRFSKAPVPPEVVAFVRDCTLSYGKAKLVLNKSRYFIESSYPEVLRIFLADPKIKEALALPAPSSPSKTIQNRQSDVANHSVALAQTDAEKEKSKIVDSDQFGAIITLDREDEEDEIAPVRQPESAALANTDSAKNMSLQIIDEESDFTQSFEIKTKMVEEVKKRCIELDYPLMEEYDFRHDDINANLEIDLSPKTVIRDYQEKCLSKMFGGGSSGGRARSGIIVLPTGAGKTLVGITAACTIKKSTIVLCTNAISVEQWANEFLKWSTIQDHQIAKFTADSKQRFAGNSGVVISTYTMISHTGKRAYDTEKMLEFVNTHEWGLMILDEVHVVPANIFRRVLTTVAAHTKLGLTATLVREDEKIEDLNFLIGPKLYEANWMDLANRGHIAKVEATEIWCPMTGDFYQEYIKSSTGKRRLLCVMNPTKFMAAEYLIRWRESQNDKIIVFSDNVFALQHYARTLGKPFIYGATSHEERSRILSYFRNNHPQFRTIFLSKVGDTSLDLPEATCLIQISSQFGSRRQEAQRMGRILRAKRRTEQGFRSRFYTLVTKDTDEVVFSAKRRTFLVDQGYEFKIVPNYLSIIPEDVRPTLHYYHPADQTKLLQLVKDQSDEVGQDEVVATADDDIAGAWFSQQNDPLKRSGFKRAIGNGSATNGVAKSNKERKSHLLFRNWRKK